MGDGGKERGQRKGEAFEERTIYVQRIHYTTSIFRKACILSREITSSCTSRMSLRRLRLNYLHEARYIRDWLIMVERVEGEKEEKKEKKVTKILINIEVICIT